MLTKKVLTKPIVPYLYFLYIDKNQDKKKIYLGKQIHFNKRLHEAILHKHTVFSFFYPE